MTITGIGGNIPTKSRGAVTLTLQSMHSEKQVEVHAQILSSLSLRLPSAPVTPQPWSSLRHIKLADPDFFTPQPVDIIIGAETYSRIIKPNIIRHHDNSPIAQLSLFGWLLIGPTKETFTRPAVSLAAQAVPSNEYLNELLTRFWALEEVPANDNQHATPEEQQCEEFFKETHRRDSTGRYVVRLPLNDKKVTLGDSYKSAYRRLLHTIRKFRTNQEYRQMYTDFMKTYEEMGHMIPVPATPLALNERGKSATHSRTQYYLPHHGVLRPESTTTKLRVVFDGSCTTSTGKSLNDFLHIGEKIQPDITDVLLRIRQHRFIFATDISKMFRQIKIHPDDWELQRILWLDSNQKIVPYHLTTVTYGTRSAPFLAVRVLQQLIEDEGAGFPLAVPAMKYGRYVDDIFGGADTSEQLSLIADQLIQLCRAGGFPLSKWLSNCTEALKDISPIETNDASLQLGDCTSKLLGLCWHVKSDSFTFNSRVNQQSPTRISKRTILSEVAQTFDPLGFLSPLIVKSKMLIQDLWLLKLGWDASLPPNIVKSWQALQLELTQLDTIRIPRWIHTSKATTCELHGFSDSSLRAMAAAVYLKVTSPSGEAIVILLCAKTKVSPPLKLTIPRLELTAALTLAKLVTYVQATLQLDINSTTLWTDSSCTLKWICTHPSRWKDFVRNRVATIQQLTSNCSWRYVPGKQNPADCATRGISVTQLTNHPLWWTGPPWLSQSKDKWPGQPDNSEEPPSQEARPGQIMVMTTTQPNAQWELIFRYSRLRTLLHVTARILRAVDILRKTQKTSPNITLFPRDIERANLYWAKSTQVAYFKQELRQLSNNRALPAGHPFHRLTAFIDDQGLLRVGGRLKHSTLSYQEQHPIILPRHSPFTTLVIQEAHHRTLHGGTQQTLADIRQSYWIVGGRRPVKSFILRCMLCARQRGRRAEQLMGQLPSFRARPSRAFQHTGVDYAGPLTLKSWKGRGAKQFKAWICVFVCMSTSAVHIEVVCDYTSESFIAAYRRFTARRGICHSLYSDCGTTFLGADKELRQLFDHGSKEGKDIAATLTDDHTHWHFNPPAAPHMGGKWEAAVKSIKFHLKRTMGETTYTLDEITTLLTQIEAILNSRPIEPLSDDPDDLSTLTPGHFLIGTALTTLPEPDLQQLNVARLNRWQLLQHQIQQFWNRWSKAFLQRQLAITKWWRANNQLQAGSLVLLSDERTPPSKWPLARVVQLHYGVDGLARVATIKTATTTLVRPIVKLAILPSIEEGANLNQHQVADGGGNVQDCND